MNDARRIADVCQKVCESTLYAAVFLSPWPFGSADPIYEFLLACLLSIGLISMAVWLLLGASPSWRAGRHGVAVLMGLVLLALTAGSHLVDLPNGLVRVLAPGVSQWVADPLLPIDDATGGVPADESIAGWFAGSKLGLNAVGSSQAMMRLLVLASLFGMVAIFQSPQDVLRRLSVVGALVGTLLAIFGLAQHFGSHDGLVYWLYEVDGGLGFGPFVNRNHYPFFLNLCLGLTIGLLLDRLEKKGGVSPRVLMSDSVATWLLVAISFMVASLIVCVSRGGVVSAFLAISIVGLLRFQPRTAKRTIAVASIIVVPTLLILIWVGFRWRESRLNTLSSIDTYTIDGRWYLWKAALQSFPEFPWFGSGGETYRYWETIHQTGGALWSSADMMSLRADNEFVDVLNEFGLVGWGALLTITVGIVICVIRSIRSGSLAAGGSIGLLAVLFHSCVDFGLRVPSTGVFAIIVAGLVCAQPRPGESSQHKRRDRVPSGHGTSHRMTPRLVGGALAIVVVAIMFNALRCKRRYFDAERFKAAATEDVRLGLPMDATDKMKRAVTLTPEDAILRMEWVRMVQIALTTEVSERQRTDLIETIMTNSRTVIRLCPLAWEPYAWLAEYATDAEDPADRTAERIALLRHARRLHPSQPKLAFLIGKFLDETEGLSAATQHWQDSLTYSADHVDEIFEMVGSRMTDQQYIDELLPPDPVITLAAARHAEQIKQPSLQTRIAERTLELLARPESIKRRFSGGQVEELRTSSLIMLGRTNEAIDSQRRALNEVPENVGWRLRLAQLLIASERLDEATREVRIILTFQPENSQALRLQQQLSQLKASNRNSPG